MSETRPSARQRGYTKKWERAARLFLKQRRNKVCVRFGRNEGCTGVATQVDHVIPHRGDMRLFWDRRNWQPMCAHCHSLKTVEEISGRKPRRHNNEGMPLDGDHHWNKEAREREALAGRPQQADQYAGGQALPREGEAGMQASALRIDHGIRRVPDRHGDGGGGAEVER